MTFGRSARPERWWLAGDPVASALFDALSATFPDGERFFVDSVRWYADRTPPALQAQIAAFVRQELVHSREHVAFNRHMLQHGRDLEGMQADGRVQLDLARQLPRPVQLATTVCMEHFTAILGRLALTEPRLFAGADPQAARLWLWHALEELEHKAVAFDTLSHATRRWPPPRRWLLRVVSMTYTTVGFLRTIRGNFRRILADDGVEPGTVRRATWRYLWIRPGLLRRLFLPWLAFFRPGFHPFDQDDRGLIAEAERKLGLAAGATPPPA